LVKQVIRAARVYVIILCIVYTVWLLKIPTDCMGKNIYTIFASKYKAC
jgi:hypothetical protein